CHAVDGAFKPADFDPQGCELRLVLLVALGNEHQGFRGSDPNDGVIVPCQALIPALRNVKPARNGVEINCSSLALVVHKLIAAVTAARHHDLLAAPIAIALDALGIHHIAPTFPEGRRARSEREFWGGGIEAAAKKNTERRTRKQANARGCAEPASPYD